MKAGVIPRDSSMKIRLKDEAWNFAPCPHPQQTEACYLYEFSRENKAILDEVAVLSERIAWRKAHDAEIRAWLSEILAENPSPDLTELNQRATRLFPHFHVTSRLHRDLTFLAGCSQFPKMHWLELKTEQRRKIAHFIKPDRTRRGFKPEHLATQPTLIMPLKEYLALGLSDFHLPERSDKQVFSVFWPRSDRDHIADFKQWLTENRPPDQPPAECTSSSASRKTSPRDHLKCLAAFRLLRAFKKPQKAREHTYDRLGKMLYLDDSAWLKAAKKAALEIEDFQRRFLLEPPSVG